LRERSTARFNFGEGRFAVFAEANTGFFRAGFLAEILRPGRVLRAAGFLREVFFFFSLAIVVRGVFDEHAGKKRTLN
jgi:hypothetical protein